MLCMFKMLRELFMKCDKNNNGLMDLLIERNQFSVFYVDLSLERQFKRKHKNLGLNWKIFISGEFFLIYITFNKNFDAENNGIKILKCNYTVLKL